MSWEEKISDSLVKAYTNQILDTLATDISYLLRVNLVIKKTDKKQIFLYSFFRYNTRDMTETVSLMCFAGATWAAKTSYTCQHRGGCVCTCLRSNFVKDRQGYISVENAVSPTLFVLSLKS